MSARPRSHRLLREAQVAGRMIRHRGIGQVRFWFIALAVGVASGIAAVLFRLGIENLQAAVYGTQDVARLHSHAASLAWYWVLMIPIAGGLVVGLLLHRFTRDGRVRSVAEVIEGAALFEGRVERRRGLISALASLITLSTGGSTGREGPVVHLASVIATYVNGWTGADGITGRELLGCAVAAAVSASFNAPIAGALFALEVVLRHFAIHAFAPIVIASAAGTVVNRLVFGDVAEFRLPVQHALTFYAELPAFLLLGLVCGLVAVVMMRAIFWAEDVASRVQHRIGLPPYLRPAVTGAMLGALAIWFPHIIGVGYETTSAALTGELVLHEAIIFAVLKVVAVAITLAGRMGGGVFSPSLMLGALTGLAFGILATALVPEMSGEGTLYALAGMGAVAAAVLGAPISTTLIVFELTGDWQTGLAVMVTVSISSALASRMVRRSYFLTQLERRGVRIAAGPQSYLRGSLRVEDLMRAPGDPRAAPAPACSALIAQGVVLPLSATAEEALAAFERTGEPFMPVIDSNAQLFVGRGAAREDMPPDRQSRRNQTQEIVGVLYHVDVLKALNRALSDKAAEEHS